MPEADVADGQQREDRQSADPHSVVYTGGMVGPFNRVIASRDVDRSEHPFEAVALCGFTVDGCDPAGEVEVCHDDCGRF